MFRNFFAMRPAISEVGPAIGKKSHSDLDDIDGDKGQIQSLPRPVGKKLVGNGSLRLDADTNGVEENHNTSAIAVTVCRCLHLMSGNQVQCAVDNQVQCAVGNR